MHPYKEIRAVKIPSARPSPAPLRTNPEPNFYQSISSQTKKVIFKQSRASDEPTKTTRIDTGPYHRSQSGDSIQNTVAGSIRAVETTQTPSFKGGSGKVATAKWNLPQRPPSHGLAHAMVNAGSMKSTGARKSETRLLAETTPSRKIPTTTVHAPTPPKLINVAKPENWNIMTENTKKPNIEQELRASLGLLPSPRRPVTLPKLDTTLNDSNFVTKPKRLPAGLDLVRAKEIDRERLNNSYSPLPGNPPSRFDAFRDKIAPLTNFNNNSIGM